MYLNENECINYSLTRKEVKNINLRIKPDGTIHVSANKRVPQGVIDDFILSKADFVLNALEKYKKKQDITRRRYFEEDEICDVILRICSEVYPYFEKRGIKYPQIKFRRMVSRWGSCQVTKGILTFNTNLAYAPVECIECVVLHEFTHFLQANHSGRFYEELVKTCPDWKERRKELKKIIIR